MCDFIRAENIKSLLEYIVSKHFSDSDQTVNGKKLTNENPSLEDIANPYGDTLKQLRKKHEENIVLAGGSRGDSEGGILGDTSIHETLLSNGKGRPINKKALEDQVSLYPFYFH